MREPVRTIETAAHISSAAPGESEFQRLLEKLPAAAYTCDREGMITWFNRQAVQLWGRKPRLHDAVDRFCGSFKLFHDDGRPMRHDQCWMALALRDGREYNGHEVVIERPDGQRLVALAHANPIWHESGNLLGAVNVLVDISERKRSEERLREADRGKNEFIAILAHELRNPLAPIHNAVTILTRAAASGADREWAVYVIRRQAKQLARLVDDLLDLGGIANNKLQLERSPVDVAEVVAAAVEISRPLIDERGHALQLDLPARPLRVHGDAMRLAQVVSNLLNNAAKYTLPRGRIWLTAEQANDEAVLTVRDTGIGIPADMLPRIFDMFTQVDRSLEHSRGGLGIGLTLARRLLALHGGTIGAHSDGPGKGSCFTVRLPLTDQPGRATVDVGGSAAEELLPLRVLVVDDNEDAAESLSMLLGFAGSQVRRARDGLAAVSVAEEFRPQAVLLDIGLPKMNGYDSARAMRRRPWGKDVLLIALTGWGQDADRRRSEEAGFDHHLVKPVDFPELLALLHDTARRLEGVGVV
jgi:PAS domain S-box-containing protein